MSSVAGQRNLIQFSGPYSYDAECLVVAIIKSKYLVPLNMEKEIRVTVSSLCAKPEKW